MKICLKVLSIFCFCFLLIGCENDNNKELIDKVNDLEDKLDYLLEENGLNSNIDSSNNNEVINDGEGNTTIDTSEIENTLNSYSDEANNILSSINNLKIPSNRSETIDLFFEWKSTIDKLDSKLDFYEDELESFYYNNKLSYSDYRKYDYEIESIEGILDKAEDTLEFKTNYDD